MRKLWQLRVVLPAACLALVSLTPDAANAQEFQPNKYTDPQTNQVLEYNLVLPPGYDAAQSKKYPLWVCLHAASDKNPPNRTLSSDGKCYVGAFTDAKNPSFFMVPISQTNQSGWGDAGPNSPITQAQKFEGRLTVVVIKELMTKYKIDEDRLYIAGPSMGARGSWDIIRRNPGMFAAAGPAAGPADPRDAALYASQNIWAINGSDDSTANDNTAAIDAIRALGGNPIYTLLQNRGHNTWRSVFNDSQFVAWMYAQRRGVPWWSHDPPAPTALEPDPQNGSTTLVGGVSTVPPQGLGPTTPFPGGRPVGTGGGGSGGSAASAGGSATAGGAGAGNSAGAAASGAAGQSSSSAGQPAAGAGGELGVMLPGASGATGGSAPGAAGNVGMTSSVPAEGDASCSYGRGSTGGSQVVSLLLLLASVYGRSRPRNKPSAAASRSKRARARNNRRLSID